MADLSQAVTEVSLQRPYTVYFRHGAKRFMYIIDNGGLKVGEGGFPIHGTPDGSIQFSSSTSMRDLELAAVSIGARITENP